VDRAARRLARGRKDRRRKRFLYHTLLRRVTVDEVTKEIRRRKASPKTYLSLRVVQPFTPTQRLSRSCVVCEQGDKIVYKSRLGSRPGFTKALTGLMIALPCELVAVVTVGAAPASADPRIQ
jgi:hypothetical protein